MPGERQQTEAASSATRRPETIAFAVFGGALIIAGGLVAAVNSASPFEHGSWLAAYLVLVAGVAQVGLGVGRLALPAPRPSRRRGRVQLVLWNAGNAGVMAGVLADAPALVTVGSVLLLVALASFVQGAGPYRAGRRWAGVAFYRVAAVSLAASVIVGSALAGAAPGVWL